MENWKYKKESKEPVELKKHLVGNTIVPVLEFTSLSEVDFIMHCFSTRQGGVSNGIFESMNLGLNRGDDREAVLENYKRMASVLHTTMEHFVLSDQTHTTNVRYVDEKDMGKGISREREYTDVDGLITDVPGVVLTTFYADCVPLFFVDPVNKAIGLSHSGWRGTVNDMVAVTIEAMRKRFGSRPEELICAIGPSICVDCYEVSEDVALQFKERFGNDSEIVQKSLKEGKYQLNLWKANERILLEAGVLPKNLTITGLCTCCNSSRLFSHRASMGKRGNLAAFLAIKS